METQEEYRTIERMNASTLVHALHSMRRLKRALAKQQDEPTVDMLLGISAHVMCLEPDEFGKRYAVMPDYENDPENRTADGKQSTSKATGYYKQKASEFRKSNSDREIITQIDYDTILQCIVAIDSKPGVRDLIDSCDREKVLLGEIAGIKCKGRVDLIKPGYLCDLKTTRTVEPREFGRTFSNLRYGFKMAFYRELANQNGYDIKQVQIIAQETSGDFDTVVYDIPDAVLRTGMLRVYSALEDYKRCMESGVWPGVDRGEPSLPVLVPSWDQEDEVELQWDDEPAAELDEVSPF